MKGLFEKLKSLDKKVYIIAGVAVVAVIAVVITLIVCLGNKNDNDDVDPDDSTMYENTYDDKETDMDDETTSDIETDIETEVETETETDSETDAETDNETDAETETKPFTPPVTNPDTSVSSQPSESTSVVTTPNSGDDTTAKEPAVTNPTGSEIIGAGSKNEPYMEIPTSDMTVTTVSIPAGKSMHYGIYRVGGMILTVNNANAYVVYGGTTYNAVNGVVTIKIDNALASDAIMFEIGNKGSAPASFKLVFTSPTGSYSNPTIVKSMGSDVKVSLEEGNEIGHYFKYYAEKDGVIRFYMTSSVDSVMLVTNNRNSAQRTSEADAKTDEQGREYIEVEVNKGDELIINLGTVPNKRGKYPAADITWSGKFA